MTKRSISESQRAWLVSELQDWQSRGMLSVDQATPILDLYESSTEIDDRKRSKGVLTLVGISALLVGLGVLLLVAYNWEAMPDPLKLLIIFAVTFGTHALGFYFRFRHQSKLLPEVFFFLGCFFYGAGIYLVAQIFNLNVHFPAGFWWWSLGVLPFAICMETPLLHALLATLLAIWCGTEILDPVHSGSRRFASWANLPAGAYTLPILALPGLLWGYRKGSMIAVTLYVTLLAWWLSLQPISWEVGTASIYLLGWIGGLMLALADTHAKGSKFALPYRAVGVLMTAIVLTLMSFFDFNREVLLDGTKNPLSLVQMIPTLILSAITLCGAVAIQPRKPSESSSVSIHPLQILRGYYVPTSLWLLMVILLLWNYFIREPFFLTIVANAAMIAFALWLMSVGLREEKGQTFAAGVAFLLFWAVLRYVDLFGDYGGMLGAALIFFFCGGVLFGFAVFWRNRIRKA
ncbi:MAG: DUF2157 domain-containing protein [Pirellula sp.]|jgi:uncharacterized membrane protein|nr:DUF2157 domain-containing protein [Pirellula sp.]